MNYTFVGIKILCLRFFKQEIDGKIIKIILVCGMLHRVGYPQLIILII